jgi:hypothetical protein
MDRDGLLRAICRPAQFYRGEVSADLAERLIAEGCGREDELSLIQHGLMRIWNDAEAKASSGGKITLDTHQLDAAGGLSELLSRHADEVMLAATPDERRQLAVERVFRALIDINAAGQAVRRPQAFADLVGVVGVTAEELRTIIDAFRVDGVSFLTPYWPIVIEERSVVDISHEALIRCWQKIANQENGWLKREFDDGLRWRSLILEAKAFTTNKKRILSPATIDEREPWFAEKTERWSDRYGGNWPLVRRLIETSAKSRDRRKLFRKMVFSTSMALTVVAAVYALRTIERKSVKIEILRDENRELKKRFDEAQFAGRDAETFPQADEGYFFDMDNGVALNPDEIRGRNMWMVWSGGNDRFWDTIIRSSLGTFDLLKVVTSHPSQTYCYGPCNRDSRWSWLGAVNEPCFEKPTGPIRSVLAFGSMCAARIARPSRSRMKKNIPA